VVRRGADGERVVHIVGTAHVSPQSVEEVQRVIREVRPDTVCVELDRARYEGLTDPSRWAKLDVRQLVREGRAPYLLASLMLQTFQRRLGKKLGVRPGAELLAAVDTAREVGAEVVLADRDVQITLQRTWGNLGPLDRVRLMVALVASLFHDLSAEDIEALKNREHISDAMSEFAKAMPRAKAPLIDERDAYLMSKINEAPGKVIVAVVGAGHVEGMRRRAEDEVDRAALEQLPRPTMLSRVLRWLLPAVVVTALLLGWRSGGMEAVQGQLAAYAAPASAFALLFSVLAGAKVPSMLVAALAAPICTLVPIQRTGVIAALVDAAFRRPAPDDAVHLGTEVASARELRENPFARVLIVATAANVGSSVGGWIGAVAALVWM
jgi:pheromone shutdown-related protein TraB